jgi:23S rRNA (cytosine1962-C5)-methyltransferase
MAAHPKDKSPAPLPRLRLRVSPTAESILRSGHPWLFADSVREQNREGRLGELAVVYDRQDKFLAVGLFDPGSPLRLRVLHAGKPRTIDPAWWQERLRETVARRDGMFDAQTTGFRWINGESDGWPGLVVDRYHGTLVMKLYTAAWLPRLAEIQALILAALPGERLVLRLSRNIQALARDQFKIGDGTILHGPPVHEPVVFLEHGLRFEAEVLQGQKTGFFLDQRENRAAVESFAAGRDVLNAFSFSGGFSLHAARGGAVSVTDVDISAHALESARRNFALNQQDLAVAACRHERVQADVFEWLQTGAKPTYDLIILDPPSLAKREAERAAAIQAYGKLTAQGLKWLRPGGILVAASCSAHVTAAEFFGAVRESARGLTELRTTGHPPDHAARFKEAEYLKCIYFQAARR